MGVPIPPSVTQQTFNGIHTAVRTLEAKNTMIPQANATLPVAALARVLAWSR
jgi:hypothetical protein